MGLEGQVAIVTGGGRGIGRGISLCLAEDGADIVIADALIEGAQQVAAEVEAKGRKALAIQVDVTKPDEVQAMVKTVIDTFGKIDILVNNAGVGGAPGWREHPSPRLIDWDTCYDVNVKGVVICSEAVVPHMRERRSGKIVNIASIAGRKGGAEISHYCASKAAVISWTQSLANMVGRHNVRVNAICPGMIWTDIWSGIADQLKATVRQFAEVEGREVMERVVRRNMPLRREQTPEDIGYAVCFFVSERARNITGQALNVDAGMVMN